MQIWDFDKFSDSIAMKDDQGDAVTYSQLKDEGDQLADAIGRRCLVFCLCENKPASVIGYTACINHDIVPLMLRHDIPEGLFKHLFETYRPAFLWMPEEDAARLGFNDVRHKLCGYVLAVADEESKAEMNPELALLITTSGSTGSPKLVRQSYRNIRANTDSIVDYLRIGSDEKGITTLPMNYVYGLSIVNTHLAAGAMLLLTDCSIMQKAFWDFFKKEGATSFAGVPYTYEMLDRLRFYRQDFPSLRTMTQAGGKILPKLHQKFAQYAADNGKHFVVMYGAAEATSRMGYLPSDMALSHVGCMGIPIPGGRFELEDVDGGIISEPGKTGELVYYGDNVTMGYALELSDLVKGDERHGRYETGDMASFDEDGIYSIVGRKKRFLKIFGNRVNLDDAERLLKTKFQGYEAACAGKDDALYIFSTDDAVLPEMKRFLAAETGLHVSAFKTRCVESIPHNSSGKVLYSELSRYY
ncbi:MAG: AMP-binding protein [Veillonellaceae bacterium]|nr:AMP-binding protein [Veillonellaceae bacterium]MDD6924462.1 AMP-binding protein [Veillonellaceae bacterium]